MKNPAAPPKTRHVTLLTKVTDTRYKTPYKCNFTGSSRFLWLARIRAHRCMNHFNRAIDGRKAVVLEENVW